jgi:ABC-type transport system involved in multi-copper enzyme maturation permease subunit
MATRAVKPKRDDNSLLAGWESVREQAPSVMRADQPTVSRYIAVVGLMLATVGASALIASWLKRPYLVGPEMGFLSLAVGVCGLLFHAFNEKDFQYRRLYGALGAVLLAAAIILRLAPVEEEVGRLFVPAGVPCLLVGLLFLVSFTRNETDEFLRKATLRLLLAAGAVMILVALVGSNVGTNFEHFLLTEGTLLLILGLMYVAAYIAMQEPASARGYWAGFGLGVVGVVLFLNGLVRPMFDGRFLLVPSGVLLLYLGLEYFLLAIGICSDNKLVVLTRRELAAFFYSPIAYIVLFSITVVAWWRFWDFVYDIADRSQMGGSGMLEPIVGQYFLHFFPVIAVVVVVPMLTMRLFSEERRTGTLEVLLTAPVSEWSVVMSKFLAALRFYLFAWYPWALFMLALRVGSGEEFDVRPLLSFFIALAVTGAGFLAMGEFFSSLTRNQIAAFMLTFMGMIVLTGVFWFKIRLSQESTWGVVLNYISYIDLWIMSVTGSLAPRYLVVYLSAAVFWLFLTTKVLDARKWS